MKKCIKCLCVENNNKVINVNQHLTSVANNWFICKACKDSSYNYSKEYYKNNKKRYKNLQQGYKEELTDYYVKKLILGNSKILKWEDIPKAMVEAKRNQLKLKKTLRRINE